MTPSQLSEIKKRLEAADWDDPLGKNWKSNPNPRHVFNNHAPTDIRDLIAEVERLREALEDMADEFADLDDDMPTSAGCIECTQGTVPNNLNKGLCAYHRARAALEGKP